VPSGLTNLESLDLPGNLLTNLVLPSDLHRLETLDIGGNALTGLILPSGLTSLTGLFLVANQLTILSLPPDMTNLAALSFLANPLTTLVLSERLAASTNLDVNLVTLSTLRNQGVTIFTYPEALRLTSPRRTATGAFTFTLVGPPGRYAILNSTNLSNWNPAGAVTNAFGSADFTNSGVFRQRFFRATIAP
jgi:hypothetical protein